MKKLWYFIFLNSACVIAADSRKGPHPDLKSALVNDYGEAKKVALELPDVVRHICYTNSEVTDPCAGLLKLLIHVKHDPSESRNPFVIENIKKNVAQIVEKQQLSPQTINRLAHEVLNHKIKNVSQEYSELAKWYEKNRIKNLYLQFPPYLKESCLTSEDTFVRPTKYENGTLIIDWSKHFDIPLEPICYRLALLFYGLSEKRDMNGVYHPSKKEIKENIKKIGILPCFKSGFYTQKDLINDFIKAGRSSTVDQGQRLSE